MKIKTILLLMICSLALVACNDQKEASKVIEIQELINFDEVQPDTLQQISNTEDVKIIEKHLKS